MEQILVRGTLGDCFCAALKLNKNENFHILHYTIHKQFYNRIKEIYSIFPNIKGVEFVEFMYPEVKEISGIPEKGMTWFPKLNLPYIPISPDESYIVICPHAGREDMMARKIDRDSIRKMIEMLYTIRVVMLGTDKQYKHIRCYENLIGETSITEAMSIIIDSSGFCGPEGFPCFVALSHKIPSVVFWIRKEPVEARLLGNPWQSHIVDLINIGDLF